MFKIVSVVDATNDGIELYERFKGVFGEAIRAQMRCTSGYHDYELTLFNSDDDEMIFRGCFSAGYPGEGPRGTCRVLKDAGFDITDEFIKNHECFDIHK